MFAEWMGKELALLCPHKNRKYSLIKQVSNFYYLDQLLSDVTLKSLGVLETVFQIHICVMSPFLHILQPKQYIRTDWMKNSYENPDIKEICKKMQNKTITFTRLVFVLQRNYLNFKKLLMLLFNWLNNYCCFK